MESSNLYSKTRNEIRLNLFATGKSGTIGKHLPNSIQPLSIDLSSPASIRNNSNFDSAIGLLHLAGVVGMGEVAKDIEHAYAVNVNGAMLLAKEFYNKTKGKFYYISTSHVYAPTSQKIVEEMKTEPSSIYAQQKLDSETLISEIYANSPERLCIIRVFSVLDWDVPAFTLGGAVKKLTQGDSDFELSNSDDQRDFLTPKSIAAAIYGIASSGEINGIVNLCSGVGTSVRDAANRMLTESGYGIPIDRIKPGNSANPCVVGDNTKLVSALPDLNLEWQPSRIK